MTWSGFVDGTENPAGDRRVAKWRFIKDGVDAGGSYVFVQRWGTQPEAAQPDERSRSGDDDRANQRGQRRDRGDERPEPLTLTRVDLKEDGKG